MHKRHGREPDITRRGRTDFCDVSHADAAGIWKSSGFACRRRTRRLGVSVNAAHGGRTEVEKTSCGRDQHIRTRKFQRSCRAVSNSLGWSSERECGAGSGADLKDALDGRSAHRTSEIARPPRDKAAQRKKSRPSPPSQPTAATTRCTLKRASMPSS